MPRRNLCGESAGVAACAMALPDGKVVAPLTGDAGYRIDEKPAPAQNTALIR